MRKLFCIFLTGILAFTATAQELNCKVEVLYDRIQNVDPKVFITLKKSLTDFLNNRRWTTDNFRPAEKIECNFLLNLTAKSQENVYDAILNIQSSRPVYNSSYHSPMVNFVDREVKFRFDESQVIQFEDNQVSGTDPMVSNLTAVLAYYVYLVLGFDYDSFSPRGGEDFFKKALNVVNNAPEEGKAIKGWKAADGNRNRYWIIEQLLNPRFDKLRPYIYTFHRNGLDLMSQKPEEARKNILEGIPILTKINNDNPSSILLQFFFNSKSPEFVNILSQTPADARKDYIDQLSKMDVPNTSRYRNIK